MILFKRLSLLLAGFAIAGMTVTAQEAARVVARGPVPDGTKIVRDLAYGPHERNKLDLYIPPSDGPLPLVVWVHGGGWEKGSKAGGGPSLDLLAKGYAVASINYRLSQQAVFPAQIVDCKAAIRYLRSVAKEYNLDPDHVGVWGMSAGGHLVALLGATGDAAFPPGPGEPKLSGAVQAVCDWFGPADFLHWGELTLTSPAARRESSLSRLLGGLVPDRMDLAKQASPVTHVCKSCAPFFICHGDRDWLVPLQQSEALDAALKAAGVESKLVVVRGGGHGGPAFASRDLFAEEEAFFAKHLKVKAAK
jgi:acetyl esterase/lipase